MTFIHHKPGSTQQNARRTVPTTRSGGTRRVLVPAASFEIQKLGTKTKVWGTGHSLCGSEAPKAENM